MLRNRVHHQQYESLISKLLNGERLLLEGSDWDFLYVSVL
jgi:hypothetical protein